MMQQRVADEDAGLKCTEVSAGIVGQHNCGARSLILIRMVVMRQPCELWLRLRCGGAPGGGCEEAQMASESCEVVEVVEVVEV